MPNHDECVLAIDIGGSKISIGIINIDGIILEQYNTFLSLPINGDMIIKHINSLLAH